MVSCGRNNIRLWRVRNGLLRSCSVDLGEYQPLDFTDVAFEEGDTSKHCDDDRTLWVCKQIPDQLDRCIPKRIIILFWFILCRFASSRSGYILEIDYNKVVISNVRRLTAAQQQEEEEEDGSGRSSSKRGASQQHPTTMFSISISEAHSIEVSVVAFLLPLQLLKSILIQAEHHKFLSESHLPPRRIANILNRTFQSCNSAWLCTLIMSQVQPSPSIASVCPPRSAAPALKTVYCVCGLSTSLLFSSRLVGSLVHLD